MHKGLQDRLTEQQRIVILQLLNEDTDGCLNNQILQKGLEIFGHNISLNKIDTECAWLEEQGCVEIELLDSKSNMKLVTITQRGIDVVLRRSTIPGIDKPIKM